MKTPAKAAIAMFSGAAALALTVGFGGVGVSSAAGASTTTTHPSSAMAAGPASHAGVHAAVLTGCIPGANC